MTNDNQWTKRIEVHPIVPSRDMAAELNTIMTLIGKITNAWAGIEGLLCHVFADLAQTDIETATIVFYTPGGFMARMQIVTNMARHLLPECSTKAALLKSFERLATLARARNDLIHASYGYSLGPSKEDAKIFRQNISPGRKFVEQSITATTAEFETHLDKLHVQTQFLHFVSSASITECPSAVRQWARIVLNTSKATSS